MSGTSSDGGGGLAAPGEARPPLADRRRALQLLIGGSALGTAVLLGVPVLRVLGSQEADDGSGVVEFERSELGLFEARMVVLRGVPVLVIDTGEEVRALSAVCSHLGCVVQWKKARRQFFCPCHGGRFDLVGRVLGGPAPRPLQEYAVEMRAGRVLVRAV